MASTTLAFDLIGRDRSAGRTFDKVGDKADRMGDKFRRVTHAAGLLAAGAAGALAGGLVYATKAAAGEEQEMTLLANALRKNAKANDSSIKQTEKWITATQNATGVADGDLRPALAKLVGATKDTSKAQKLLKTGLDFSAQSGKSLDSVATALTKAYNGNVGALGRLGIKVQDSEKDSIALQTAQVNLKKAQQDYTEAVKDHGVKSDEAAIAQDKVTIATEKVGEAQGKTKKTTIDFQEAMKRLNDQFGGAAAAKAETTAGKFDILKARMHDLAEQIGAKLLPKLTDLLGFINDSLIPALGDISTWFKEHVRPQINKLVTAVNERLIPALEDFAERVGPDVHDALDSIGNDVRDTKKLFDKLTGSVGDSNTKVSIFGFIVKALAAILKESSHKINGFIHDMLDPIIALNEAIEKLFGYISAIPDKLSGLKGAFNGLPDWLKNALPDVPNPMGAAGRGGGGGDGSTAKSVPSGAGAAKTDQLLEDQLRQQKRIADAAARRNRADPLTAGFGAT